MPAYLSRPSDSTQCCSTSKSPVLTGVGAAFSAAAFGGSDPLFIPLVQACLADECKDKKFCHKVIMNQVFHPPWFHWALDTAFGASTNINFVLLHKLG